MPNIPKSDPAPKPEPKVSEIEQAAQDEYDRLLVIMKEARRRAGTEPTTPTAGRQLFWQHMRDNVWTDIYFPDRH